MTEEEAILNCKSASELASLTFDADILADNQENGRRAKTAGLRVLWNSTQSYFYHVLEAHDHVKLGMLDKNEWETWNGIILEMGAHPLFLAVIAHGHRNRYFPRDFAKFVQAFVCPPDGKIPEGVWDKEIYRRNVEFVKAFYPAMLEEHWADSLPDYGSPEQEKAGSKGLWR